MESKKLNKKIQKNKIQLIILLIAIKNNQVNKNRRFKIKKKIKEFYKNQIKKLLYQKKINKYKKKKNKKYKNKKNKVNYRDFSILLQKMKLN